MQPHEIPSLYSECHVFYLLLFSFQFCIYKEKTSQRYQKEMIECNDHEKKGRSTFFITYILLCAKSKVFFSTFPTERLDEFYLSFSMSHFCRLNQMSSMHLWVFLISHLKGHKRHNYFLWLSITISFHLWLTHKCWTMNVAFVSLSVSSSCLFILKTKAFTNPLPIILDRAELEIFWVLSLYKCNS